MEPPHAESLYVSGNLRPLSLVFILPCKVNGGGISRSYLLRAAECIFSGDCKDLLCDIKAVP